MSPSPFATLPTLENLRIASPCEVSWDEMEGDDRQRFCQHCRLSVYNLTEMTRDEAQAFLAARGDGRTCVRYFQRADGTVLTRDCPVGLAAVRQKIVQTMAAAAALFAGILGGTAFGWSLTSRGDNTGSTIQISKPGWFSRPQPLPQMLMGDIACPAPIPTSPTSNPSVEPGTEEAAPE